MEDADIEVAATACLHLLEVCTEFAENLKKINDTYPEVSEAVGIVFSVQTPALKTTGPVIQVVSGRSDIIKNTLEELHDKCK